MNGPAQDDDYPTAPMPPGISADLAGYQWARDDVGQSGGGVYRLHGKAGAPDLYLKHGKGGVADDIMDEMVRLRWLKSHVPVPAVTRFIGSPDEAWLLTTALPGETACQVLETFPDQQIAVIDALAMFLRRLHAIPISDCPFTSDHAYRLARARERIEVGLVEDDDFDEDRSGWTAEQVWDAMQPLLPMSRDPVVTHGDFSLDNIMIHDGKVVGCIDVGRVGIADRYQDLAILLRDLKAFDGSLQDRFLSQYGIAVADQHKLQFHLLLDELF